ncbi:MAG: sigma 54-interacting transcriptional regulator [Minicystis sp.]
MMAGAVDAASTLDVGGSSAAASGERDDEAPALLIAWAAAEPDRVGEIARFEPGAGALILGRGEAGDGRVVFQRQRPGRNERTPALASPGISREQLRIRAEDGGLRVDRLGKCAMEVRGEAVDRAVLAPGDTLLLKGQLLLLCTRRPFRIDPLRDASLADAPPFGAPDAHGIVGESPAIWRLRDQLAWTARADEHTLLLGASGSGKELCARALHTLSPRAAGPFVARNAATIPEGLVDAELFGNVKGYPNPGMPERPGLIGAADGGTLFLDEIGELPQRLQANLLRVLDEGGEYHRLGSSTAQRSRFRLVGATNRDLAALKHDLGARLVLRIDVPGLDARRDDIPLLARHLLRRAAAKSPAATRRFWSAPDPAEIRVKASLLVHLLATSYATNVRALDALLWRAMSESPGDAVEWLRPAAARSPSPAPPPPRDEPPPDPDEARAEAAPEPTEAENPRGPRRAPRQRRAHGAGARAVEPVRALPADAQARHRGVTAKAAVDPRRGSERRPRALHRLTSCRSSDRGRRLLAVDLPGVRADGDDDVFEAEEVAGLVHRRREGPVERAARLGEREARGGDTSRRRAGAAPGARHRQAVLPAPPLAGVPSSSLHVVPSAIRHRAASENEAPPAISSAQPVLPILTPARRAHRAGSQSRYARTRCEGACVP